MAEQEGEVVVDAALAVVQVGVADAARLDGDERLARAGVRHDDRLDRHRLALAPGDHPGASCAIVASCVAIVRRPGRDPCHDLRMVAGSPTTLRGRAVSPAGSSGRRCRAFAGLVRVVHTAAYRIPTCDARSIREGGSARSRSRPRRRPGGVGRRRRHGPSPAGGGVARPGRQPGLWRWGSTRRPTTPTSSRCSTAATPPLAGWPVGAVRLGDRHRHPRRRARSPCPPSTSRPALPLVG